jgi:spermidine/putrescine-binding protein
MPIIESYRPSNIFQQVVSHYSGSGVNLSKRDRNAQHAYSQSLGLYYSQSLIPATYMDDLFEQTENMKYNGTRISAPDINVNSTIAAIGNSPVIEVYNTNPNQLIFTQNPESRATTGNTEPGNLIVR